MSPAGNSKSLRDISLDGLWRDNPIFRQILGICSTLAVTNLVLNTFVMCTALTLVTAASCLTVSLLRSRTPRNIRMMVQTLIIGFYVIIVDVILKAWWPDMSRNLGPYVGLILTNCIIMGRCEAFAGSNKPLAAAWDGLFSGLGYSFVLLIIAVIREVLGMGTLLGLPVPYFSTPYWDKWIIMVMPPGGFFVLACMLWAFRSFKPKGAGK
jgi:Na+-transporting NADH:ubiquinone oxidoreductase subunit D